jgi:tyrosine decarboxylase
MIHTMSQTMSQTRFYNYGFKFLEMCFEALHSAMSNKMNENGITDCYYEVIPDHERTSQLNRELLKSINASGPVYMPSDVVEGIYIKGFAVGATLTEDRYVKSGG